MNLKRFYLIISFITVSTIGSLYGVCPTWWARQHLGLPEPGANLTHMLRAIMGLYVGFGVYWLYAAIRNEQLNTVIFTVLVFDGCLLLGRVVNLMVDPTPSDLFLYFTALEVIALVVGVWVYRYPNRQPYLR